MEVNLEATRLLHRNIGKLFGSTKNVIGPLVREVPNSQYQNLCDLTNVSNENRSDAKLYLPPVITAGDAPFQDEIRKIGLTTTICNDQPVLSYQISWLERNKKVNVASKPAAVSSSTTRSADWSSSAKTLKSTSSSSATDSTSSPEKTLKSTSSSSRTDTTSSPRDSMGSEELVVLCRKASSIRRMNGKVRCEGPCDSLVLLTSTIQFGCDHVICDVCRRKEKSVALFDGSPGCCNETCVKIAENNGDKLCSGQSDSKASIVSQLGTIEAIPTYISILKNQRRGVRRTQMEFEFPTTARLSMVLKSLSPYKNLFDSSRFYYCPYKPKRRADLLPISLIDTNLRFYDIVDLKSPPVLYFVIVGQNIKFLDPD